MATYWLKCTSDGCPLKGQRQEHFAAMKDRDALRCQCGGCLEAHPDQFATIKPEREWHGQETTSRDIVFAKDADLASIKRDVPDMELKRDKYGLHRPVWRNDKHQRKCLKQMSSAMDRYRAKDKAKAEGAIK